MITVPERTKLLIWLNRLFDAERHSLLRYLQESRPYVPRKALKLDAALRRMFRDTQQHEQTLQDLFFALDSEPGGGTFPMEVAELHYIALLALLPKLIEEKRRQVTLYEQAIQEAAGESQIQERLRPLLEDTRRHLQTLQDAQAP